MVSSKHKLCSRSFYLTICRNNNKQVDLSRTFRQTGLSSGAKLELVLASRSPSVVSIALQLPESMKSATGGGRLMDKFPSNTTLWLILRKFETSGGANLNFTGRGVAHTEIGASGAGRIYYETPVLNVMGRELSTFGDMQKTLAQLGINGGSSLIRLDFQKTEQPLEEAMAEIAQYFKSLEAPAESGTPISEEAASESASQPRPEGVDTTAHAIAKLPSTPSGVENLSHPLEEQQVTVEPVGGTSGPTLLTPSKRLAPEETVLGPNQRPIAVFSAPTSETPKAALQPHNDGDYEPTIAHAKLHQSRLQNNSQNKRLPSDAEAQRLEEEKAVKLSSVKEVSIKIRFPDQSSIVSPFTARESAFDLYKYVSAIIVAEDQPFRLVWMKAGGPQPVPKDDKVLLIKDLGFSGRMLVSFNWDDGASSDTRKIPVLKSQFAQSAKELPVPEIAAVEITPEKEASADKGKEKEKEEGSGGGKGKGGVPKWLKLGKK